MATHSGTLAWKIPSTEKPGRLQSMWSQRVGHTEGLHFTSLQRVLTQLLLLFIVQSLSRVGLCNSMDCSTQASLSFTISLSLLKLMSTESVMPSNHLVLCSPLLLPSTFPSIRAFSSESALSIKWSKYWSWNFSINISPSNEYSWLISFRIDCFDRLALQGALKIFSSITIWRHQFFRAQPSLWSTS